MTTTTFRKIEVLGTASHGTGMYTVIVLGSISSFTRPHDRSATLFGIGIDDTRDVVSVNNISARLNEQLIVEYFGNVAPLHAGVQYGDGLGIDRDDVDLAIAELESTRATASARHPDRADVRDAVGKCVLAQDIGRGMSDGRSFEVEFHNELTQMVTQLAGIDVGKPCLIEKDDLQDFVNRCGAVIGAMFGITDRAASDYQCVLSGTIDRLVAYRLENKNNKPKALRGSRP